MLITSLKAEFHSTLLTLADQTQHQLTAPNLSQHATNSMGFLTSGWLTRQEFTGSTQIGLAGPP